MHCGKRFYNIFESSAVEEWTHRQWGVGCIISIGDTVVENGWMKRSSVDKFGAVFEQLNLFELRITSA